MKDDKTTSTELPDGIDLHPRHESWVRISTHNSLVGIAISLVLVALLVIVISLHLNGSALVALGVLAAPALLWWVWRSTPRRHSGVLENVGLTAGITADLLTELGASDVNVDSTKGVVTLRGSVPYADFREAAEDLARRRGAHQVINELKVTASAPEPPDPYLEELKGFSNITTPEGAPEVPTPVPLEELVLEALEADPLVDVYLMVVHVADGIAYLTGRQETEEAKVAATKVALHVDGILGVANDMEVMPSV